MGERTLESQIISGSSLREYENLLHFNRELLRGNIILNFGSGGSNIGEQLKNNGVSSNIVDLDLRFDPISQGNPFIVIEPALEAVDSIINQQGNFHRKLLSLKRNLSGIQGRTIIQGDGRALPFKDQAFDIILALKATYQIPRNNRIKVYAELLRVGNILHCAPVLQSDFQMLTELARENNYDIIYCGPALANGGVNHQFHGLDEYELLKHQFPENERVLEPPDDDIKVTKVLGLVLGAQYKGGTMILKRNEYPACRSRAVSRA